MCTTPFVSVRILNIIISLALFYFDYLVTECSVSIYGSSLTGFGLKDSDVNLDLAIPDEVHNCSWMNFCHLVVT